MYTLTKEFIQTKEQRNNNANNKTVGGGGWEGGSGACYDVKVEYIELILSCCNNYDDHNMDILYIISSQYSLVLKQY